MSERAANGRVRRNVRVEGITQGVGFRPFGYALATRWGSSGHVGNDVPGVFVEVAGPPESVEEFPAAPSTVLVHAGEAIAVLAKDPR